MKTIAEFAAACSDLTSEQIFSLFEYKISDELRNEILALSTPGESEPCREALYKIGVKYSVYSLIKY